MPGMQSKDSCCDIGAGTSDSVTHFMGVSAATLANVVVMTVSGNGGNESIIPINGNIG